MKGFLVCLLVLTVSAVTVYGTTCISCMCVNADPNTRCVHGTCQEIDGAGYCGCDAGWSGSRCQTSSQNHQVSTPCTSNPCQNNGYCNPYNNLYTCTCTPGFTGLNCETSCGSCNACDSSPCASGQTCSAMAAGGYRCT